MALHVHVPATRVLRCECDTLLPNDGLRPVTWQIRDIGRKVYRPATRATPREPGAPAATAGREARWGRHSNVAGAITGRSGREANQEATVAEPEPIRFYFDPL